MFEQRSNHTVTVHGAEQVMALGRPKALERAISNLLDNALKFDTGSSAIDVTVTSEQVEVSDRGPGIDRADTTRIFDRFFRAAAARSVPGSGLGLAIVSEVASAHGGSVFAAPRPGGGARIGFNLGAETLLPNSNPQPAID